MKTIDEHIQKDQEEFLKALAEHNDGKVRHLTEELQWLLDHKKQFPDDTHDPSPLELFCEQNPDEPDVSCMTTELVDRLGRLALASMFIAAVPGKISDFSGTAAGILSRVFLSLWRLCFWLELSPFLSLGRSFWSSVAPPVSELHCFWFSWCRQPVVPCLPAGHRTDTEPHVLRSASAGDHPASIVHTMIRRVAVSGASGKTGYRVAEELLNEGLEPRLLLRPGSVLPHQLSSCDQQRLSLFDQQALDRALQGVDALVIATGARPSVDLSGPMRVDAWSVTSQVETADVSVNRVILVSSLCAGRWRRPLACLD